MKNELVMALICAAATGAGLMGGLFFVFSNSIMSAFDRLPAAGAVAAMNSINRVILNPLFFLAFFGTGALCIALLVVEGSGRELAVAGALAYLVGSIGVTMAFNVPLNNKLQAILPSATDMETQWRAYRGPWTRWNHVRTVACLGAAALFTLSASQ